MTYGLGSALYRAALTVTIALFVAGKAFFVGVVLALWFVLAQVVLPMQKLFSFLLSSPRLRGRRWRALAPGEHHHESDRALR